MNQHEADVIEADRRKQAELMQEYLEQLGIEVSMAHAPGDAPSPPEYVLSYDHIRVVGPTMERAVVDFIEKLLLSLKTP